MFTEKPRHRISPHGARCHLEAKKWIHQPSPLYHLDLPNCWVAIYCRSLIPACFGPILGSGLPLLSTKQKTTIQPAELPETERAGFFGSRQKKWPTQGLGDYKVMKKKQKKRGVCMKLAPRKINLRLSTGVGNFVFLLFLNSRYKIHMDLY